MKDRFDTELTIGDTVYVTPNKFSIATMDFEGKIKGFRPGQLSDKEYATVVDRNDNSFEFESDELELIEERLIEKD